MDQPPTPNRPDNVTPTPEHRPTPDGADGVGPAPAANGQDVTDRAPPPPPPAPPLTPVAWLMSNLPYLVLIAGGLSWLYVRFGWEGVWKAAVAVVGLGFVIFVHELGHFLAAKWCDVHVLTFSIGFGPALPGCSWQRGETTYKIAVLPLGGYVNMVGEGIEAEEDEDYPRSFKNKSVGQRMLIISAGVVMNVLLGCVLFVLVYRLHGVERAPATVWTVEAGSPAWDAGVRPGWSVVRINDSNQKMYFRTLKVAVALKSQPGKPMRFVFDTPEGDRTVEIQPQKGNGDMAPKIGITSPIRLQLRPAKYSKDRPAPVRYQSAAASARALDLAPGDVVLAASDPAHDGEVRPLPAARKGEPYDAPELCRRMSGLAGKPMKLRVKRGGGSEETLEVQPDGFHFDDVIVGITDPDRADDPFRVSDLPLSPRDPTGKWPDPFVFRDRMRKLEGRPVVIRVRREGAPSPVNLLVPPAYHFRFGLRMKMGEVAATRDNSPAARAGLAKGDVISKVRLQFADEKPVEFDSKNLDPVRLPDELVKQVHARPKDERGKWAVTLTVRPSKPADHDAQKEKTLPPMQWEDDWSLAGEDVIGPADPLAIPQLGLAYYVESTVVEVRPDTPAARRGLRANDRIEKIQVLQPGRRPGEQEWSSWFPLTSERVRGVERYDEWAYYFKLLQEVDYHQIKVRVRRDGNEVDQDFEMAAAADDDWPLESRGLMFQPDVVLRKADNFLQALQFGGEDTVTSIQEIYLTLSSLLRPGGVSARSIGGPIEIASQAWLMADDPYTFLLFLGMISVNLAVVNFLPIPVLDGGHMVFLLYEWLRGKPPSEGVRAVATYIGLALLAALLIFVFYVDISRRWFGK